MDNDINKKIAQLPSHSRIVHVLIEDKRGIILEEDVKAVTSYNDVGIFDVLPLHTNFITLVHKKVTVHREADSKDIDIGTGLMKVADNEIHIYVGLPEAGSVSGQKTAQNLDQTQNSTQPSTPNS